MKSFSNDIITPEAQTAAIKEAFSAQNMFMAGLAHQVQRQATIFFAITYTTLLIMGGLVIYMEYFK